MSGEGAPNFITLADQAWEIKSFNSFKATVRIAMSQGSAVTYEELPGWRFGRIIVHKDRLGLYQVSSVNGYAFSSGQHAANYPTQRGALRAAWVISHFTDGVLNDAGEMIVDVYSATPELKAMRAAIIFCDMEFR
jgi:hypothetical protein